jgi:hypothetical protein
LRCLHAGLGHDGRRHDHRGDAKRARIENTWRDGSTTTIVPAVPNARRSPITRRSDRWLRQHRHTRSRQLPRAGGRSATAASMASVAAYWGSVLQSNVDIVASVSMPQIAADCSNRPPYYGAAPRRTMRSRMSPTHRTQTPSTRQRWRTRSPVSISSLTTNITITLNEGADHGCEAPWSGWWYGTDAGTAAEQPHPHVRRDVARVRPRPRLRPLYNVATGASPSSGQPIWGWYLYDVSAGKHGRT